MLDAGCCMAITIDATEVPLAALQQPDCALALITGTEGSAYRPVGAGMVIAADGSCTGTLSSGCIERDVVRHALAALATGQGTRLRYGRGSPFFDLKLPCGGGLDVTILPRPDRVAVAAARSQIVRRTAARLRLQAQGVAPIELHLLPPIRFAILGSGPEPVALARLAQAAGYALTCATPDGETAAQLPNCLEMAAAAWPAALVLDDRTAVTLFFHDHDREPPLLAHALASPAFYVGAQGSRRAAEQRDATLAERGVPALQIARLRRPFGSFPSARNPRALAVSVMADVLATAPA